MQVRLREKSDSTRLNQSAINSKTVPLRLCKYVVIKDISCDESNRMT